MQLHEDMDWRMARCLLHGLGIQQKQILLSYGL
jgi:hypothetical protein